MANEALTETTAASTWQAKQVYAMAGICLVVGLAIGFLFRGSQSPASAVSVASVQPGSQASAPSKGMGGAHMPTLDQMKQMADKKAAPLLERLKTDPNNSAVLSQVGAIYQGTHQFQEAVVYFEKAVQADPKNVATRTQFASCLYYNGDVDGAISQLQQALRDDPKDANSLFNLGMIKWQGKQDSNGAIAAWKQLLKSNPQLSAERKATVQKLLADVQMQGKS